jgi:hypothetical protein
VDRRSFIAAVALWAATPRLAAAQGWVLLGSRTINWASGRDSIMASRAWRPVSMLSFRTRGGEIFLTNVEVSFTTGGRERIPVHMWARQNLRSNPIRLRNLNRDIRRIDFSYRRVAPGRGAMRTTLDVFGRR